MGNGLASFAVGFGGGYMGAKRQGELDKERQADRAMRQDEHNARMGEVNDQKNLRMSLADAARPVTVESGAGGMLRPQSMDDRDVGLPENAALPNGGLSLSQFRVKDKSFGTQALADTAAAAQNAPAAVTGRLAQAYSLAGKPVEAITLQRDQTKYDREQNAFAAQARQEGFAQTAQAMLGGDAQQVFDTYNKQGQSKLKELPKVTRSEIDVPGVGKMPNYTYSGILVDANGKETPLNISSHDANMGLLKYKDILELGIKGNDSTVKQQKVLGDITNATEKNRLTGEATAAKAKADTAQAALAAATAEGKPMNDSQSKALLFGSRMREADKTLQQLASEGTNESWGQALPLAGGLVTAFSSPNQQMLKQAKTDFLTAVLRRESGASISTGEFTTAADQYFPKPLDSPEVIAKKAATRQMAINGILLEVPERHRNSLQPRSETPSAAPVTSPAKAGARTVTRTGNLNGKRVVQYSDGTTEYAN